MWNFLEFAAWLRGKGIIRMKLWNLEDVQGSAQSETGAEFSLGLAHRSSFEPFFRRSCRWEQQLQGGRTKLHHSSRALSSDVSASEAMMGRSCFSSLRNAGYFLIYQRRLKQREHSAALLRNGF